MYSHNFIFNFICTDIKKKTHTTDDFFRKKNFQPFLKVVLADSIQDSNKHLSTETRIYYCDKLYTYRHTYIFADVRKMCNGKIFAN